MMTPNEKPTFKINFALKKKQHYEDISLTFSEKVLLLANVSPEEICLFCQQIPEIKKQTYYPIMVARALYSKYSSSQQYYYAKDCNDILSVTRTQNVFLFKDDFQFDSKQEYAKRFYKRDEQNNKLLFLTEYYKYHKEICRLFMLPIVKIVNKFHDKQRRVRYKQVMNIIDQEQGADESKCNQVKKVLKNERKAIETGEEKKKECEKQCNKNCECFLDQISSFNSTNNKQDDAKQNTSNTISYLLNEHFNFNIQQQEKQCKNEKLIDPSFINNTESYLQQIQQQALSNGSINFQKFIRLLPPPINVNHFEKVQKEMQLEQNGNFIAQMKENKKIFYNNHRNKAFSKQIQTEQAVNKKIKNSSNNSRANSKSHAMDQQNCKRNSLSKSKSKNNLLITSKNQVDQLKFWSNYQQNKQKMNQMFKFIPNQSALQKTFSHYKEYNQNVENNNNMTTQEKKDRSNLTKLNSSIKTKQNKKITKSHSPFEKKQLQTIYKQMLQMETNIQKSKKQPIKIENLFSRKKLLKTEASTTSIQQVCNAKQLHTEASEQKIKSNKVKAFDLQEILQKTTKDQGVIRNFHRTQKSAINQQFQKNCQKMLCDKYKLNSDRGQQLSNFNSVGANEVSNCQLKQKNFESSTQRKTKLKKCESAKKFKRFKPQIFEEQIKSTKDLQNLFPFELHLKKHSQPKQSNDSLPKDIQQLISNSAKQYEKQHSLRKLNTNPCHSIGKSIGEGSYLCQSNFVPSRRPKIHNAPQQQNKYQRNDNRYRASIKQRILCSNTNINLNSEQYSNIKFEEAEKQESQNTVNKQLFTTNYNQTNIVNVFVDDSKKIEENKQPYQLQQVNSKSQSQRQFKQKLEKRAIEYKKVNEDTKPEQQQANQIKFINKFAKKKAQNKMNIQIDIETQKININKN